MTVKINTSPIIPTSTELDQDTWDRMRGEFQAHIGRAQELYEKALQAHMTGASNRDLLFRQAIIEQNAALLCQGQLLNASLTLLLQIVQDVVFGDEEDSPEAEPSRRNVQ
ncbi:hypothetical protein [Symbiobacterium terraclitae]|uniref:hypothetical protein n=1 Tax=Symbiobacterium terraclitae TaxID=557451 RepID=UPI0035B56C24